MTTLECFEFTSISSMFDCCCKIPPPYKPYSSAESSLSSYCTISSKGVLGQNCGVLFSSFFIEGELKNKTAANHTQVHRSLNPHKEGICNTALVKNIKFKSVKSGRLGY